MSKHLESIRRWKESGIEIEQRPINWQCDLSDPQLGTLWRQATNYATNTHRNVGYKPSPYYYVEECYESPVARFGIDDFYGVCEKHKDWKQLAIDGGHPALDFRPVGPQPTPSTTVL